jgi:hypothetical protein
MNNEDKQHGSSSSQPTLYCILARYNYFIFFSSPVFMTMGLNRPHIDVVSILTELMRVEKGGFLSPAERTGAVVKAIQRG